MIASAIRNPQTSCVGIAVILWAVVRLYYGCITLEGSVMIV